MLEFKLSFGTGTKTDNDQIPYSKTGLFITQIIAFNNKQQAAIKSYWRHYPHFSLQKTEEISRASDSLVRRNPLVN